MVRVAPLVALGCLLGNCGSMRPEIRSRDDRPVRLCTDKTSYVDLVREEPLGGPDPVTKAREYLLDLKVHVQHPPGAWLLVGAYYFPAHIHDVRRLVRDTASATTDPDVDWLFQGDGFAVKARWLPRAGDVLVPNLWAISKYRAMFPTLARISVGGLSPQEWVAQGGRGDHRSIDSSDAVPVTLDVVCTTMITVGPRRQPDDGS